MKQSTVSERENHSTALSVWVFHEQLSSQQEEAASRFHRQSKHLHRRPRKTVGAQQVSKWKEESGKSKAENWNTKSPPPPQNSLTDMEEGLAPWARLSLEQIMPM